MASIASSTACVKITPLAEAEQKQQQKMMTAEEAARLFAVPEPKIPHKSIYVRFKALLQKDCKSKGIDVPDTKEVKEAWSQVKNYPPGFSIPAGGEDKENDANANKKVKLVQFKLQAEQEDARDRVSATAAKIKWCEKFTDAAAVHLHETAMRCRDIDEFKRVVDKAMTASRGWPSSVPRKFGDALEMAQKRLVYLQDSEQKKFLFNFLVGASNEQIYAHVHEHVELLKMRSRSCHLLQTHDQMASQNREIARRLKGEIIRYFKQQMHEDAKLKRGYQTETYRRGGVTRDMFQQAFGTTSKSITLDPSQVGYKPLRYGAYLAYTSITVRLEGSDLVACGRYAMTG